MKAIKVLKSRAFRAITVSSAWGLIIGCGPGLNNPSTVRGSTSFIMGPSTTVVRANPALSRKNRPGAMLVNGNWILSPDKANVTFKSIDFHLDDGSKSTFNFSSCNGLYDRSKKSGASLFQCPVQIPTGKIISVTISIGSSADILINDSFNGIYTDPSSPTLFNTSPPAGGGQFVTVTIPNGGNSDTSVFPIDVFLTSPFTVSAGDTPSLYVIVDLVHTIWGTATGGVLSVNTTTLFPPAQVYASFTAGGSSEFYTTSGSAGNVSTGSSTSETYVRVNYTGATQAAHVWTGYVNQCAIGGIPSEAWSVAPANSPLSSDGLRAGGYLGLDNANNLGWALPTDFTYGSYHALFSMPRASTLGATSALKCIVESSVPAPADGNTYASGVPSIPTPTTSVSLTLVAK